MPDQYIKEVEKKFVAKTIKNDCSLPGEVYSTKKVESILKSVTEGELSNMLRCQPSAIHMIQSLCKTILERKKSGRKPKKNNDSVIYSNDSKGDKMQKRKIKKSFDRT